MLNVLLITENIGGQVLYSLNVENYMGYQFISGPDLMDRFEKQVEKYNVPRKFAQVKTIEEESDAFVARTGTDDEYRSKRLLLLREKDHERSMPGRGEIRWSRR